MGKIRIVKQYGAFRVEAYVTKYQYNEPYKTWETVKGGESFESQEGAEMFAERYLHDLKNKKEVVIKEYNF